VKPNEEFTVKLVVTEYGWAGYDGREIHLNVDNGDIVRVDSYNFEGSPLIDVDPEYGRKYLEIYIVGEGVTLPVDSSRYLM
jgi:hypothetical protein